MYSYSQKIQTCICQTLIFLIWKGETTRYKCDKWRIHSSGKSEFHQPGNLRPLRLPDLSLHWRNKDGRQSYPAEKKSKSVIMSDVQVVIGVPHQSSNISEFNELYFDLFLFFHYNFFSFNCFRSAYFIVVKAIYLYLQILQFVDLSLAVNKNHTVTWNPFWYPLLF